MNFSISITLVQKEKKDSCNYRRQVNIICIHLLFTKFIISKIQAKQFTLEWLLCCNIVWSPLVFKAKNTPREAEIYKRTGTGITKTRFKNQVLPVTKLHFLISKKGY